MILFIYLFFIFLLEREREKGNALENHFEEKKTCRVGRRRGRFPAPLETEAAPVDTPKPGRKTR